MAFELENKNLHVFPYDNRLDPIYRSNASQPDFHVNHPCHYSKRVEYSVSLGSIFRLFPVDIAEITSNMLMWSVSSLSEDLGGLSQTGNAVIKNLTQELDVAGLQLLQNLYRYTRNKRIRKIQRVKEA